MITEISGPAGPVTRVSLDNAPLLGNSLGGCRARGAHIE
jgi:hypothetical protein